MNRTTYLLQANNLTLCKYPFELEHEELAVLQSRRIKFGAYRYRQLRFIPALYLAP